MQKAQANKLSKQCLEGHGQAQLCNAGLFAAVGLKAEILGGR